MQGQDGAAGTSVCVHVCSHSQLTHSFQEGYRNLWPKVCSEQAEATYLKDGMLSLHWGNLKYVLCGKEKGRHSRTIQMFKAWSCRAVSNKSLGEERDGAVREQSGCLFCR